MSEAIENDDIFLPLYRSAVGASVRLSHYGIDTRSDLRTGNPHADVLLDSEWINRNGFENATSRRVHLMYLHLYGSSGQTVRHEIDGLDRSEAKEQMLKLEWPGNSLETVIESIDDEKERRQTLLWEKLPSGRIPLFRGVHCMSPADDAIRLTALQRWTLSIIRKGVLDGTVQLHEESNDPTGYVRGVEPFTSTVDSWTCSYEGARYWSRTTIPGNEVCMVMAANVAHSGIVLWRNDSGAMDEILVLGGTGAVNVYFQPQMGKVAADESAS